MTDIRLSSNILKASQKRVSFKNLKERVVEVDKNLTDFVTDIHFQIRQMPDILGAGNNLIYIDSTKGTLQQSTPIDVEIIDSNGNPVYLEFLRPANEDQSRAISITIDSSTASGEGVMYIVGSTTTREDGSVIDSPTPFNLRCKVPLYFDPTKRNTSPVFFGEKPKIEVTESMSDLKSTDIPTSSLTQSLGTLNYEVRNNKVYAIANGFEFNDEMIGGKLSVTMSVAYPPTESVHSDFNVDNYNQFTASIEEIVSTNTALLSSPYVVKDEVSKKEVFLEKSEEASYTIEYTGSITTGSTANSRSYAIIEMSNVKPITGEIAKIKTYQKQKGNEQGGYKLLGETEVNNKPLFTDNDSIDVYNNLGSFKDQNHIDTFYELITNDNSYDLTSCSLATGSTYTKGLTININPLLTEDQYVGFKVNSGSYINILYEGKYVGSMDIKGMTDSNNPGNPSLYIELRSDDVDIFNRVVY